MGHRKNYEGAISGAGVEREVGVQSWSYGGGDVRDDNVGDDDGVHPADGASVGVAGLGPAQAQRASQREGVELDEWARQVAVVVASCNAVVAAAAAAAAVVCASSILCPAHVPWRAPFRYPLYRVHLVHNRTRQAVSYLR